MKFSTTGEGLTMYPKLTLIFNLFLALLLPINTLVTSATPKVTANAATADYTPISRVSVSTEGLQADRESWSPAVSGDGRFIAFSSSATNLVAEDTNGTEDVFVFDRSTLSVQRVSVNSAGEQANGASLSPNLSADGRFVAFISAATNLVEDDTNDTADTFLHDRLTGETARVSIASDGSEGDGSSFSDVPALSADGCIIAFGSYASNLVPEGDLNGDNPDVYIHDCLTRQTRRVSVDSSGNQGNDWSWKPDISADGRFITFSSFSNNLITGDTNQAIDVFVHDMLSGETSRVSVSSLGVQGNGDSQYSAISSDGRFVTFGSSANNLVIRDLNGKMDIFVHDRQTSQTTLVSIANNRTQGNQDSIHADISGNGQYILFDSIATNLVGGDTNNAMDLFVHNRLNGTTKRISTASDGAQGNDSSRMPSIDQDGCVMSFASNASNLVSGDSNGFEDIFAYTQVCLRVHLPFV
jgi:tricorn protease-like protein